MGLITRQIGPDAKGSKLTFADMDNNLYYLQGLGVSGFTYSANTLTITNPTGGTKSVNIASDTNTFITAATYNDLTNTITLTDNTNTSFNVYIDSVSGLTVNGTLSATTISGGTLYGDGSNLTGISTQDTFVTGGTYSNGTAIFTNNTGGTFNVTGFTTGNTLQQVLVNGNNSNGNNIIMSESDNIIFKYAGYNNNINTNTLTSNRVILFPDNSGTVALLSDIQTFTGGTVTGATNFTNGLTANTISATTYFNLPDNVTGNYLPLSGGTVTGQTFFTSGLTITGDTIITDSTGTSTAIDTSTRELVDSSSFVSVDWRKRLLYDGAGNATIDYDGAILYDSTSIPSVNWFSRQTYDDLGVLSIDWRYGKRRLYDVSSNESLDWDIRTLTKSDGTTVSFDWENGILTGQTNIESSTISATTISGGTLYGDGSNLTGIGGGSSYIYEVGEYVVSEGGVIAHRWISTSSFGPPSGGTVQNYLVLDTTDLSTATVWSTGTTNISDVESFWDGLTNTNNLISAGDALGITPTSAAGLCYNSTNNGKTDWYLPSIGELAKVNSNRWEISQGLSIAGGTQIWNSVYWSSTELTGILSWAFNFDSSVTTSQTKTISSYDVRAMRKFSI